MLTSMAEWLQGKYYCKFSDRSKVFDYGKLIGIIYVLTKYDIEGRK